MARPQFSGARSDPTASNTFPLEREFAFRFEHVDVVNETPAYLGQRERLALYTMVAATAPDCALEIGTFRGGGSLIISSALTDLGRGQLVSLDPDPASRRVSGSALNANTIFYTGRSPDDLPGAREAIRAVDGFQFCFIDASHAYRDVKADLWGVMEHLADEAYVLLHDAYFDGVSQAIQEAAGHPSWFDGGMLVDCRNRVSDGSVYGGLYLLRFVRSNDTPRLLPVQAGGS